MANCKICGEPSGYFPLCKKCNELKDQGKIVKCEECGEWHYSDKPCKCKPKKENIKDKESNNDNKCIICENDAPSGPQCRNCYYEMMDIKESFDKNTKPFELKDYYFNLKSNIFRMQNFEYIKNNSNKLIAIAYLLKELHKDESLSDRVINDVKEIITTKKPKAKEQKVNEYTEKQDSQKETIIRSKDGHIVKSDPEATIDDILYELGIVHCYEKKVSEISNAERTLSCDWFIPVLGTSKGIYIEYWGMNTKDYNVNKEEKRKLYKEHNIPLIEINKDETKGDHQGLSDRIRMEAIELAEKYFNVKKRF